MYFEAALYMGRAPLNLPETGRTFSVSVFGYIIALNVRTTPPKFQVKQQPKIDRTPSSCPCVPGTSGCIYPCNREVCKADTDTPQTEIQSVEEDRIDTCSNSRTTPSQGTENTEER